jgi:hypothetical protein
MRLGIASGVLPGRLRSSETGVGSKKLFFADVRDESISSPEKFQARIRRRELTFMIRGKSAVMDMTDWRKKLLYSFIMTVWYLFSR